MHRLNMVYAQVFNRKHGFAGHLFDARYWSRVLGTEDYLLDASRYVVLNPVRAGLGRRTDTNGSGRATARRSACRLRRST